MNKRLKYQFRLSAILSLKQNIYTYVCMYVCVLYFLKVGKMTSKL